MNMASKLTRYATGVDESGDYWETPSENGEWCKAEDVAALVAQHTRLVEAAKEMRAVIGVLFGHGENAIIPEQVDTPLRIPVKLRAITDEVDSALSAEPASNADKPKVDAARVLRAAEITGLLAKASSETDDAARLDLSSLFNYGTDDHAIVCAYGRINDANVALARAAIYTAQANALIHEHPKPAP